MVQSKLNTNGKYRVEDFPEAHYVVGHGQCIPCPNRREANLRAGELRALLIRGLDPDAVDITIAALNGANWDEIDPDGGPGVVANKYNIKFFTHDAIVGALNQFANTWAKADYLPLIDKIVRKLEEK